MNLSTNIDENITQLQSHFGIGQSFDMVGKDIFVGPKRGYMVMVDGLTKDLLTYNITSVLQNLPKFDMDLTTLIKRHMAYMEVEVFTQVAEMELNVLSGAVALFIDGFDKGLIINTRETPIRAPAEPDLEKVTRGPRDGFVETIIFNTALIRRRIRDPKLRFEVSNVGNRSKTSVAVAYIDGLADPDYVKELNQKISEINVEALTMAEKSLAELLIPHSVFNPMPQVRFTERPDVAAAHLNEGHVLVMVDTSPSVIILPTTIFHFTQHAEDYYQNPTIGTYLRWIRFTAVFLSFILTPLWLLSVHYQAYVPDFLQILEPDKVGHIPILIQFLLLELGIDILKISSIHTPTSMSTSLGIIGGLILGDLAVQVGWLIPEAVLYMAVVAIGTFATPSIEFAMAIRMFRLLLLILTGVFKLPGFIIGLLIILVVIARTNNSSKKSFLWPLIPFNWNALVHVMFRSPTPKTPPLPRERNASLSAE